MTPLDDKDEWESPQEYLDHLMAEIFLPTCLTEQAVKEMLDLIVRTYDVQEIQ